VGPRVQSGQRGGRRWKRGGYVFHFSRNSAVTNLSGAGIPDTVAMTITGHRTLTVYKRYRIWQESAPRAAMEKVEAYVHGLTADHHDDKRKAG
jgi:hypothetical protein